MNNNKKQASHFVPVSPDKFMGWLISELFSRGTTTISVDDANIERRLRMAVSAIEREAMTYKKSGEIKMALALLDVLEELRPDPNTGAMNGFWAALRRQQPHRAKFPNPRYKKLVLCVNPDIAKKSTTEVPLPWAKIVRETANEIAV